MFTASEIHGLFTGQPQRTTAPLGSADSLTTTHAPKNTEASADRIQFSGPTIRHGGIIKTKGGNVNIGVVRVGRLSGKSPIPSNIIDTSKIIVEGSADKPAHIEKYTLYVGGKLVPNDLSQHHYRSKKWCRYLS